jgi:hypothetical protein
MNAMRRIKPQKGTKEKSHKGTRGKARTRDHHAQARAQILDEVSHLVAPVATKSTNQITKKTPTFCAFCVPFCASSGTI